ncbi:MAG: trypsin-like peptidase domain-containing protein [Luteolibacter sp.]
MNRSFRRILILAATFVFAFAAVTAVRTWRSGGSWRDLFPWILKNPSVSQPEIGTLATEAPLKPGDVQLLTQLNDEYAKLTQAVVPSVVSIDTAGVRTGLQIDPWGRQSQINYPTQGQGSGVIVTKEGHVITNHHVIAGQQQIRVTMHGGVTHTAHLIGEDTLLDIAVLKIDATETFTPLKLGDSLQAQVGQMVFAVGNPFGLGETVTQGIISAKERSISDNQRDLFQTDAAINPGNSGGPLVNLHGEIIGINAAIFSQDKQNPGFQGVGFSIPSNDVREALDQILKRGRPIRGFLGVQMRDMDPAVRNALGYGENDGAAVLGVSPGSPAQAAGLLPWDVIRSVNGQSIQISSQLFALVQRTRVGDQITLDVWRKGKAVQLKPTIAESGVSTAPAQPSPPPTPQGRIRDPEAILQALGIQVRELSGTERLRGYGGVAVNRLTENALAGDLVKPNDIIFAVNNIKVGNASEFYLNLAASAAVQDTTLSLYRDDKLQRVNLPALPRQD